MSFIEDIKNLRKRYFDAVKMFYGDKRIIAKMMLNRSKYDNIYEADLAFRTIMLREFSDEELIKLTSQHSEKSVDGFVARARGCFYAASVVQSLLHNQISNNQNMACNEIRYIKQQLLEHGNNSIKHAERIAKKFGLPNIDKSEFDKMREGIKSKFPHSY